MQQPDWSDRSIQSLGMLLHADAVDDVDAHGKLLVDDALLLIVNGGSAPVSFALPTPDASGQWAILIGNSGDDATEVVDAARLPVAGHALMLLAYQPRVVGLSGPQR
jgi:pullulanase/glycogen debranching enzyme